MDIRGVHASGKADLGKADRDTTARRVQRVSGDRFGLLELQLAAGNRAVQSLLRSVAATAQRDGLQGGFNNGATTAEEAAEGGEFGGLHGDRWESNALLDATARDKARVRSGSDRAAVRLIQQALVDVENVTRCHYNLGVSGPARNGVDGEFGSTTGRAVQAFKHDEQLGFTQFADVGPRTMHRLDDLLDGTVPPTSIDPDEPQRFEPPAGPGPTPTPKPPGGTVGDTIVRVLSAKPPDMLILFSTFKSLSIPATYTVVHQLHDTHPAQFAIFKAQLQGLSLPLAARLRIIADGVENDQDMAVLDWKKTRATQLATLSQADQDAILLAYDDRHPTLVKVLSSAGFGQLTSAERDQFLLYVGGANLISRRAGRLLSTEIDSPKFDRTSAKSFQAFIKAQASLGPLTDRTSPYAHRPVSKPTPTDVGNHVYKSKPGGVPSESTLVTIGVPTDPDKTTIPVFRPKPAKLSAKFTYHTFDDIEKGLSTLPVRNAKEIKRVDVEPAPNPDDSHWKVAYKDKNFTSYMTASADQIVRVFPAGSAQSDVWMEGTFIHESAHIISERAFGRSTTGPKWKAWKDAMTSDVLHPSDYAKKSPGEDFSEMVQLFQMVKGRRREQEIRKLFPARVKILDTMKLT